METQTRGDELENAHQLDEQMTQKEQQQNGSKMLRTGTDGQKLKKQKERDLREKPKFSS